MRLTLPILILASIFSATTAGPWSRISTPKVLTRSSNSNNTRRTKEKWVNVGNLRIKIEGGGVNVERKRMGSKRSKSTTVKFSLDSIQEVNAEGEIVGKNADIPHGVELSKKNRFNIMMEEVDVSIMIGDEGSAPRSTDITGANYTAIDTTDSPDAMNLDEEVSSMDLADDAGTNETATDVVVNTGTNNATRRILVDKKTPKNTIDGGARGAKVVISAPAQANSIIETTFMFISGGGEVGTMNERWTVQPGDTKLNIALEGWTWCDPCDDGTGEFIDVDIVIVGDKIPKHLLGGGRTKKTTTGKDDDKGGAKKDKDDKGSGKGDKGAKDDAGARKLKKEKEDKVWDLGLGATLEFADDIEIDGVSVAMPEGYPKLITKRGKQMYTFRFPKFEERAWYDPVVTFDENYESSAATLYSVSRTIACGAILLACTLF